MMGAKEHLRAIKKQQTGFSAMHSFFFPLRTMATAVVDGFPRRSSSGNLIAILALLFGWQQIALAQVDDFNDGDDTGWVRFGLDSAGPPFTAASYSFPDDGFAGKAYRILTPAPPVPDAGPARAFSYRSEVYTDFYAAVDVVAWDNSLNQAFGFLIRASGIGLGQIRTEHLLPSKIGCRDGASLSHDFSITRAAPGTGPRARIAWG